MTISSIGLANLGYWGVLPMGIANYGGDTQVYNIPDYTNTNLNIGFNSMAMESLNSPFAGIPCQIPRPPIPENISENLSEALLKPVIENLAKNNVSSISSTIQNTKMKLNSILQKEGISDEDKKKVNDLLTKLDEQEKKLQELKDSENLTDKEVFEKSKEIEKAMRDIAADTAQLKVGSSKADETQGEDDEKVETEEAQGQTDEAADEKVEHSNAQVQTQSQESKGFFVAPEYAKQRAEVEEQMQLQVDAQTGGVRSASEIAQEFRDAIEGIGTDDETFEAICSQINKDNVMDLMLAYNQTQSAEHGESFMKAFMWDADHGQKAEFGKRIANALRDKALELGVYNDCKKDFTEIYDELDDWVISNDIVENFDNIVEKLAQTMGKGEHARPENA